MQPKGREGALVRAFASPQCGPGSNPGVDAICGFSLLLVLSFAPRGFCPGSPVSPPPPPSKTNISKFPILTRNQLDEEPLCGCATSNSLFIYIYIFNYVDYAKRVALRKCPNTFVPPSLQGIGVFTQSLYCCKFHSGYL